MDIVYENKTSAISIARADNLTSMVHLHKELEVIYVNSGEAVAHADRNSYLLKDGDLFITFPNQIHYYETKKLGEYTVLIFSPDIIYGSSLLVSKSVPENNVISTDDNEDLKWIMRGIRKVNGDYRNLALNGYINIIMSIVLSNRVLKTVSADESSPLHNIIDYCTHNFKEDITLDDIAENLHLSKYYISHLINKNLNQNFNEYINSLRISEACNILKETNIKIADISENVGFGTIRSFNRSFKQIIGISPAEYRGKMVNLKK